MVAASNMVICDMLTESDAPNSRIKQRDFGILNSDIIASSNMVIYSQNLMLIEGASNSAMLAYVGASDSVT